MSCRRELRLIPAHAGKTNVSSVRASAAAAHPRSRGENAWKPCGVAVSHGSSPLTRGKHKLRTVTVNSLRLIPAHAGKTRPCRHGHTPKPAHPHSRGENPKTNATNTLPTGSSPLTRGKLSEGDLSGGSGRLIPTHAGKTPGWVDLERIAEAHPRSRGENWRTSSRHP